MAGIDSSKKRHCFASANFTNDTYAWTGAVNVDRTYTTNGLNQYNAAGSTSFGYDARGNLTTSGTSIYTYTKLNELSSATGGVTMYYDPASRLHEYNTLSSIRMIYAGSMLAAEVSNPAGTILRRFVPGPGTDEPVVWYEGSTTSDRRFLQGDERGSIIAISDNSGNMLAINRYDEFGIPQTGNLGRFQYTAQTWYAELGMYNYKARIYSPTLGRFMQTDPIGYADGMNWYNYVGSDPINKTDPSGLVASSGSPNCVENADGQCVVPIEVNGNICGFGCIADNREFLNSLRRLAEENGKAFRDRLSIIPPGRAGVGGPEKEKGPCSTAVRGLLADKGVQNAISDAVKLGLSTPNWGGGPHSEAGFWAGRGPAGGVNVGGVYTSEQGRNIEVRGGDALLAGAFFDKTFFHLHLGGTGPSAPDRALADSVLFGTGANIVTFDPNGKIVGCYAGG